MADCMDSYNHYWHATSRWNLKDVKEGDFVVRIKPGIIRTSRRMAKVVRTTKTAIYLEDNERYTRRGDAYGSAGDVYSYSRLAPFIESVVHFDKAMFDLARHNHANAEAIRRSNARQWCKAMGERGDSTFSPAIIAVIQRAANEIDAIEKEAAGDQQSA